MNRYVRLTSVMTLAAGLFTEHLPPVRGREVAAALAACDFAGVTPLFASTDRWRSLTPYVLTRHVKFRGPRDENGRKVMVDCPEEQIARELSLRWPDRPIPVRMDVQELRKRIAPMREGKSGGFRPFDYFRYRRRGSNGGGVFNFNLKIAGPVSGPLILGFACHYGLGIFVPDGR